mgnify:CR=1 FL=1
MLKAPAIRRKELFANIKQANPSSVKVFLDMCYSVVTRKEEMLIAGRPIVIKAKEQDIPIASCSLVQHLMSRYLVH